MEDKLQKLAEKLDFLMTLTATQNAALARALSFDASYISRIRSGKRGLPPQQPFLAPAAAYFARHCPEPYQRQALADALDLGRAWPEDEREGERLIYAWLEEDSAADRSIGHMLAAMTPSPASGGTQETEAGEHREVQLFYGNAGKREAVLAFLTGLTLLRRPRTLLLYSDEEMTWLYEDAAFARRWAENLIQLLKRGWRVKIIHSIGRNLTEMWEAVRKWMPLYLSGSIEPWYYPRLQDGALRRTLFIAEGHSAVISGSVQGQRGPGLNLLLHDRSAALALGQEFDAFLAPCRPLMEIARPETLSEIRPLYRAFADAPGEPLAAVDGEALICVKEGFCVLIVKPTPPLAVFSIREERMVAALAGYLHSLDAQDQSRAVLEKLETLLEA